MQNFPPTTHGVPESFLTKFGSYITAVLSGFDRIRFRGVLRLLFKPLEMDFYLSRCGVLIKDFKAFAEELTGRVKAAAYQAACAAGRPVQYLADSQLSKEELARQIAQRDGIREGLIALFETILVLEQRKCTHLYHYYMHQDFGLMHVRVKSWFPFMVSICLNGRNWLARQMDRAGIDVLRFLGKNRPEVFCGELTGTLKHRAEGLRLKHTVNGNSL
jgi:hypothetical protein